MVYTVNGFYLHPPQGEFFVDRENAPAVRPDICARGPHCDSNQGLRFLLDTIPTSLHLPATVLH
jgi:hypothetical protein